MGIDFDERRWKRVKEDWAAWWAGELKRPLVQILLQGRDPRRPQPQTPILSAQNGMDLSIPVDALVDRLDYELSRQEYLGDAFPHVRGYMGAFGMVVAGFLGARMKREAGTLWATVPAYKELSELHFECDAENVLLRRVEDFCRAAMKRWQGTVQVSMPSLNGVLNILCVFRSDQGLLLDLYDHPEELKRLTWELHELWWRYFEEINEVLQPLNPGYSDWAGLFSAEPYIMLECDFSSMVSPEMFDEFVKPELVASCRRLTHSFYHLDGPGELPHLDSLLAIEELDGIQWVPTAGWHDLCPYVDLYRRIHEAGKRIQVKGDVKTLKVIDRLLEALGFVEGILVSVNYEMDNLEDEAIAVEFLKKYGAPLG